MDLLRRLPVPKGRIVIAVVLVTTMALMWGRLLLSGRSYSTAAALGAASAASRVAAVESKAHQRTKPVNLPEVAGRHDRLARDFFTTANWRSFQMVGGRSTTPPAVVAEPQELTAQDIKTIEQAVKLDGIIAEQNSNAYEAFVNDKLVSVGDQISINYKKRQLTATVISINRNNVVLGLENFTLNVAMPQAGSLNN